ncbi:hypothetical protein T02_7102 [Trichinella nativa]|uniref:Uncharacterized protein n=1 Tax=Trichinella nativa TaxID=6335 RepID=A0A0V1KKI7_9BILA|nr:hypothetical protein T02_7102 [Trichinella nativa]
MDGMELYSVLSRDQVSLSFVLLRLKSYQHRTFLAITRQIRIHKTFWKVPRQTDAYVSNKWPLKFETKILKRPVETAHRWLNFGIGKFFNIIMRYSLNLPSFVQYFLVLGKSILLHFRSISNKLKKVVSIRDEMCIKSSIC